MCDIHKLINYLISKALLTNSNTEFPREEFFTWRSRHKQDTGKKKSFTGTVLQDDATSGEFYRKESARKDFHRGIPRENTFT